MAGPDAVGGTCDARFATLRDVMRENVATHGELGAAIAVTVDGRAVADLWTGWADAARTRPWRRDTVVNVFSVGKAFAAVCVLRLVERGALELDAPVTRWWPGFTAAQASVRDVLGHRAGLPGIRTMLPDGALFDWQAVTEALAAEEPWWPPGTAHGYHVHTLGFLLGELARRATGDTIRTLLRREVAEPVGADVQFGLAAHDRDRRAEYRYPTEGVPTAATLAGDEPHQPLRAAVYLNPPGATGLGTVNTTAWMDAELPSANAHATARGVAQVYAALLDGRLLDAATLAEATGEASAGEDVVLRRPSRFGLGFQLTQPERPLGPNPRAFGHFGAGGSLGFADPDAGVAFGYVMNHGGAGWQSPRNRGLIDALYAAL